jgi:hypothetical protein
MTYEKVSIARIEGTVLVVGKCHSHLNDHGNYVPGSPPRIFLVSEEL